MGCILKHRSKHSALNELLLLCDATQSSDYVFQNGFGVIVSLATSELTHGS